MAPAIVLTRAASRGMVPGRVDSRATRAKDRCMSQRELKSSAIAQAGAMMPAAIGTLVHSPLPAGGPRRCDSVGDGQSGLLRLLLSYCLQPRPRERQRNSQDRQVLSE